jgi:hypothetical protein
MRSVNVTVGLQHLFRNAGDKAAGAKVSSRVLMTRANARGELLRPSARGVGRRCWSANRTRGLAVLTRYATIDTAAGKVEPFR